MKNRILKPIVAILTALTITATATAADSADPNVKHADILASLNSAYASSSLDEEQMAEEAAITPSQRGLFILTRLGYVGEEVVIDGGSYWTPYVAVSRAVAETPWTVWVAAWDPQTGFYYTTDFNN